MNGEELKKIIENHKHWLNKDCDGYENMRADLSNADLRNANLRGVDLRYAILFHVNLLDADLKGANLAYAILKGADLEYANLRNTYLKGADLLNAKLSEADLYHADLENADLRYADLVGANLRYANLTEANLLGTDLRFASLNGACLVDADLYGVKLGDATLSNTTLTGAQNIPSYPFIPYACPETGSFIGYKKASRYIVELEILADAKRCSATGRKCRCDKARVLQILDKDRNKVDLTSVASDYDKTFIYTVGEIVEEKKFCEDRWNECSKGIHFFINFQEAVDY